MRATVRIEHRVGIDELAAGVGEVVLSLGVGVGQVGRGEVERVVRAGLGERGGGWVLSVMDDLGVAGEEVEESALVGRAAELFPEVAR